MSFVFPGNYWPARYWVTNYWPDVVTAPPAPTVVPDLSWVNGFYTLIVVADDNGVPVGDLAADIESLSWLLNEAGQARFTVANPGTAERLLEFGNRVMVYLDNGLPPWAGFIDPPRRWRYGSVTLAAYSGERLLTHRITGRNQVFAGATAGSVLMALLAAQAGPPVVALGYIDINGAAITESYHYRDLYDVLRSDVFTAVSDFNVTGMMQNGRVRFRLNLYQRRGRDLANVWLLEGQNTATIELEEQGPLINEWLTAGTGNSWGDTGRLYGRAVDGASVARFGLRQGGKVLNDAGDQTTLNLLTESELALTAETYEAISLQAINLSPARFADYDIGDGVGVEIYSMRGGFRETRRIVGREFQPATGVCDTVLL